MVEIEELMNDGEDILGFDQEEIDALFAHFDYDAAGDLEDYENPDDDVEDEFLICPHCHKKALKEDFKEG